MWYSFESSDRTGQDRFPVTFSTLILRHLDFLWKTEQIESYSGHNILKFEKSWLKILQSLVPGLLCDLPRCADDICAMHWNTNFYRVSLLTGNFVCLCYRKKKVIIFYFQFCSNFHTKHQNFRLSIRPVPTVIGNFWAKYRFRAHIKHETKSTIL